MNLAHAYPNEFNQMEDSPLKLLLKNIESYNFADQEPSTENLDGIIGLGTKMPLEEFLKAFRVNNLNNLCQVTNDDLIYELFIAGIILRKPKLFLNNPLTILSANESSTTPLHLFNENFNSSEHKEKIMDGVSAFLEKSRPLQRLKENVNIVVDELFSNALFNAPIDENGKHVHKSIARNEVVRFPGKKNATLFLVNSENDLFVGCLDPFGSIQRDQLIDTLEKAYSSGQVRDSSQDGEGAGLGIRMMLDRSRSIYMVSERGQRTLFVRRK